jgi:cell division septation protein DedD
VKQTVAAPKPRPLSAEPAVYYLLHAGSFNIEANAIIRNEALRKHGIASYMFRKETAFGIYHVVAGKYASRQEAQGAAAQLAALGFESYISERRQRGGDQVPQAQPEAVTVTPAPATAQAPPQVTAPSVYRIMAGSYLTDAEARQQVKTLQQSGFSSYMFQQETPSGKSFHVVAGKYVKRLDANEAMTRLKALGIDHYLSEGK